MYQSVPTNNQEYLPLWEAAAYLKTSIPYLQRLCRLGKVKFYRSRNRTYFLIDDIKHIPKGLTIK